MNVKNHPFSRNLHGKEIPLKDIRRLREEVINGSPSYAYLDYITHYGFDLLECQHDISSLNISIEDVEHRLILHCFNPRQKPIASVCIFHGLFDHTGLYVDMINMLLGQAFVIYMIDLPGFGLSDGDRAQILSFNDYAGCAQKLNMYIKDRAPYLPCYAIAHSTGAAAVLASNWPFYAKDQRMSCSQIWDKIVLLAPLIYPKGWIAVRSSLVVGRYFLSRVTRRFMQNSHDDSFIHFVANSDPLQSRYIYIKWIEAMNQWIEVCQMQVKNAVVWTDSHTVCVIQGSNDSTVDSAKNKSVFGALLPEHNFHLIPKAKHHLIRESRVYQEQMHHYLKAFLLEGGSKN